MAPMFMRLLGAFFPNTLAGTMDGNPSVSDVNAAAFAEDSRNFLLEIDEPFIFFMSAWLSFYKLNRRPLVVSMRSGQLNFVNKPLVSNSLHLELPLFLAVLFEWSTLSLNRPEQKINS
jgi:hypothetical protein